MVEQKPHIPVMLAEVLHYLAADNVKDKLVVDCTFGAGGYSRAFLERGARVIGLDRDKEAIEYGAGLQKSFGDRLKLINSSFGKLAELGLEQPDIIVLDIGVSSMQIDQAERGFSFQKDGPLDMRMGDVGITAEEVVNNYTIEQLAQIFKYYGEEIWAKKIAIMIHEKRPFHTTLELSRAIENIIPKKFYQKIHPATRVFQALRIYVNNELEELYKVLLASEQILGEGGKLGVVSFHSLEDKIVKKFLHSRAQAKAVSRYEPMVQNYRPSFILPIKKAIKPQSEECARNTRARSAKFRYGIRTKWPIINEPECLYKQLHFK